MVRIFGTQCIFCEKIFFLRVISARSLSDAFEKNQPTPHCLSCTFRPPLRGVPVGLLSCRLAYMTRSTTQEDVARIVWLAAVLQLRRYDRHRCSSSVCRLRV